MFKSILNLNIGKKPLSLVRGELLSMGDKISYVTFARSFFLFLALLVLTVSFQFNYYGAASDNFFDNHQKDSESLVLGRIIESHNNGLYSGGGFLGRYSHQNRVDHQYELYENDLSPSSEFSRYTSSFGFQGLFYYYPDKLMRVIGIDSGKVRLFLNKLLTSFLLSFSLVLFFLFTYKQFGFITSFFCASCVAISQWVVVFSNNLYWMFFLIVLPFSLVAYMLQSISEGRHGLKYLCLFLFVVVFVKSLAGYEYISTILISTIVPVVFFSLKDKWGVALTIKRMFYIGSVGVSAFLSALVVHLLQLSFSGSFAGAIDKITNIVAKRTHGDPSKVHAVYENSLNANLVDVFFIYWDGVAFDLNSTFGLDYSIHFGDLVIFFAILSVLGVFSTRYSACLSSYRVKYYSITVALWFSFLAPVSWYVLAKGHSYIHTHMNHVLWYVPFLLIGFAFVGYNLKIMFSFFRRAGRKSSLQLLFLCAFLIFVTRTVYVYYSYAVNKKIVFSSSVLESLTSDIDLRYNSEGLLYVSNRCESDLDTRFFLHAYPINPKVLKEVRAQYGFENLDFNWDEKENLKYKGDGVFGGDVSCGIQVSLGYYPLEKIVTGQFDSGGVVWRKQLGLNRFNPKGKFQPFDLTDQNWLNGVSRTRAGFFISNNFENRQSIREGDVVLVNDGEREVLYLDYSERYINVYLSGAKLDPDESGYPNYIHVVR